MQVWTLVGMGGLQFYKHTPTCHNILHTLPQSPTPGSELASSWSPTQQSRSTIHPRRGGNWAQAPDKQQVGGQQLIKDQSVLLSCELLLLRALSCPLNWASHHTWGTKPVPITATIQQIISTHTWLSPQSFPLQTSELQPTDRSYRGPTSAIPDLVHPNPRNFAHLRIATSRCYREVQIPNLGWPLEARVSPFNCWFLVKLTCSIMV